MIARPDDDYYGEEGGHGDLQWQQDAACRGESASVFYPPSSFERKGLRLARESQAKSICGQCPVRQTCLGFALRTGEPHGIWGGLSEVERRQLAGPTR